MNTRTLARVAGAFYAVEFVLGGAALGLTGAGATVANVAAALCYVVVTALLYRVFAPRDRTLALLAAMASLSGIALSLASSLAIATPRVNPLALFGVFCALLGFLIWRTRLMPRWLGIAMFVGGVAWFTFAFPALATILAPFNFAPGILAELVLTVWLLARGVSLPDASMSGTVHRALSRD